MNVHPILASLKKQKTAALLIVLEIAIAAAILCNALYLVSQRVVRMQQASGIDEAHLVFLETSGGAPGKPAHVANAEDLAALRALPGVRAAITINTFPFIDNTWNTSIALTAEQAEPSATPAMVLADEHFLAASGVTLLQGRWFNADEILDVNLFNLPENFLMPSMVITQSLAHALFPGENALGKTVYGWNQPIRIIGITADMLTPGGLPGADPTAYQVMFLPIKPSGSRYVLRTQAAADGNLLHAAEAALARVDAARVSGSQTFAELRRQYYSRDRAAVWMLVIVSLLMLAITAFGISGLASFWVAQRTRQIGIRRALGATRGDILRHFQSENFLIVSAGIVLGLMLAFGLNQFMMTHYELPRLPWQTLPITAFALWLLGQLAVLAPALRATRIPPAIATRSV